MTLHRALRYTIALALLGMPAMAGAQAFGLNEIGSCAIARGLAVTGAVCDDPSTIYWNPGAMPKKDGFTFLGAPRSSRSMDRSPATPRSVATRRPRRPQSRHTSS